MSALPPLPTPVLIRSKLAGLAPAEAASASAGGHPPLPTVKLAADVVVAGGGMSGVCTAVAAARCGARVILLQDRSRLGGNSSSEVRMHIVGANCHKNRPGWRESGLLEEFRLDDAVNNPQRCREMWDLLLYDKVIAEENITLLLDTTLIAATQVDGRIREVLARCDKTEHLYAISGQIFCDCTGDGRLAYEAGADYRRGRESREEFGESLAPARPDNTTLGSTILFTAKRTASPQPFRPYAWSRKIGREQLRKRTIKSWEYGYWWIEWGGHLDTIKDDQRIRFELLSIVTGLWDYIKNSGDFPESSHWALDWVGMLPGRRESRRILGEHILTQHDLVRGGVFDDAVAIGGWPMDDHPPGGFDGTDDSPGVQAATLEVYNIPLRALCSRNISNLLMAGRNISATHVAFTSTRVMGTCSVMGQAVGTAAALCIRHHTLPKALGERKEWLTELQQTLLRFDQTIKGVRNLDSGDVARQAHLTASGEDGEAGAENIINGWTRDFPGPSKHLQPEQDVPFEITGECAPLPRQINHWAAPLTEEGAWIELRWDTPRRLAEIQLTFDSGFQRELTLTSSDTINPGILRGPQPETVRAYAVLYQSPGDPTLRPLVRVTDNHQRINRHRFNPVDVQAVRVLVTATHGDPNARIFEVRCYA